MIMEMQDRQINHDAKMIRVILNEPMKIEGSDYVAGELVDMNRERAGLLINAGKADRYRMPREGK
jgi:hypothetical protein